VDTSPMYEGNSPFDGVAPVLPNDANLTGPFAPSVDQYWVSIAGINSGSLALTFSFNYSGSSRSANLTLLGQTIPVFEQVYAFPARLTDIHAQTNGSLYFDFTNLSSTYFTVYTSTNLAMPLTNWTPVGSATNMGSALFQYSYPINSNEPQRYFRVAAPTISGHF